MSPRWTIGLVLLCILSACSRDDDKEASASGQQERPERQTRTTGGGAENFHPGAVRNSYVERNWQDDEEPENEWTEEFKAAATSEERIAVMDRKQASGSEMLAPLIRLALRDPDERVRMEAARMLRSFTGVSGGSEAWIRTGGPVGHDPSPRGAIGGRGRGGDHGSGASELPGDGGAADSGGSEAGDGGGQPLNEGVDLVVAAVHDPSSEVRILAMEAAFDLEPETQLGIYERTIAVPDETVRRMTITELGRMVSKPAFEILTTGLQTADPVFHDAVNFEIKLLVHREFESFQQARAWWDENAGNYTDDMVEVGGSP